MQSWSILSTLAVGGALAALPTYAEDVWVYERQPQPYDMQTRSDVQNAVDRIAANA